MGSDGTRHRTRPYQTRLPRRTRAAHPSPSAPVSPPMRHTARLALLAPLALALGCDESPTGPAQEWLTPGQSRFISGGTDYQRLYRIEVPEGTGTLQVLLSEGTGDADLVLRFGAPPETGAYDCVSEAEGNEEECIMDAPDAGTWYILVVGFEAYRDVRLLANLGATSGAVALQNGVPVGNLAGGAGSFRMFRIEVPAGTASLEVTLDGPTGDADLYLRRGSFPLLNAYDQASFGTGNAEEVLQFSPAAGTWYVRVEGFEPYAGVTLTATVTPLPPLRDGP